jgi:hypothetical protein
MSNAFILAELYNGIVKSRRNWNYPVNIKEVKSFFVVVALSKYIRERFFLLGIVK